MRISNREFDEYVKAGYDALSDMCVSDEEHVYRVEWCGRWGKHWSTYVSREAMEKALDRYDRDLREFVLAWRKSKAMEAEERARKARELREMRSLGAQFPGLKEAAARMQAQMSS